MDAWFTPACYTLMAVGSAMIMAGVAIGALALVNEWRETRRMRRTRRLGRASEPVCLTPYLRRRDDG